MKSLSCLIVVLALFPIGVLSNPTERFEAREAQKAIEFAGRLSGTKWIYHWRGKDYEFRFNENGSIGILESWKNVRWVVSGKNDVVLEGHTYRMLLHFNEQEKAFYTRDWDGSKADGRLK